MQNKPHQPSTSSSTIVPSGEAVSPSLQPEKQGQEVQQCKRCFYCNQAYPNDKERVKHIGIEHQGKLYYPTQKTLRGVYYNVIILLTEGVNILNRRYGLSI